jgi:hypothetical protein
MVAAGFAAGCWFRFRPPVNGNSNAGWLRSGTSLVRFALFAVLHFGVGVS